MKITLKEAQNIFDSDKYSKTDLGKLNLCSFNAFDTSKFHIANNAICYEDHCFSRFSKKELEKIENVSKDVHWLANHTAGVELQFITDSRIIKVKCKNLEPFTMKNMSFMGMGGFDCYYYDEQFNKFMFNRSSSPNYIEDNTYIGESACFTTKKERKIILNFPLYNGVLDLDIILEEGSSVRPWEYDNKKKIVCYGTSILQGCSSSHPGIATTNKVSRYFKQEVLNYGFSGSALLEKEVAEILADRKDVEMYIIDAEANAGMSTKLYENLENFVSILFNAHKDVPIVIMNRVRSTYDGIYPNTFEGHEFNDRVMKEVVETFKNKGANIRFVSNWDIFPIDDSEMTIEGLHPSDNGMNMITEQYIRVIKSVKEGK